ncbi:MAG: capsule assembly Wzi family protein [Candidatus Sulfotelmatobacter sp.]|jgi:membrane-associated phospholipid phosphatase
MRPGIFACSLRLALCLSLPGPVPFLAAQSSLDHPQEPLSVEAGQIKRDQLQKKVEELPEIAVPSAPLPNSFSAPEFAGTWNVENNVENVENVENDRAPSIPSRGASLLNRFAGDQRALWTSPLRLRPSDAIWGLPALAGMGTLLASDSWLSKQVSKQIPARDILRSRSLSNDGTFAMVGAAGGMFLLGKITHNEHAAETGFLASEAAVNALAVDFALKSVFQRQRPYVGSGAGHFFARGSSFPSEHAAVSWAIAGVVAHEYPGTLTKLLAYGLASAVTIARVTGKEHFPSDAVVGGAMGYFIARQIYQRRRDPEVSVGAWSSLLDTRSQNQSQDKVRSPRHMGSAYVPLESWVYPALERLAALGYVETAYLGIRPWTRMECARLLDEANDRMRGQGDSAGSQVEGRAEAQGESQVEGQAAFEAAKIYAALENEFSPETGRLNGAANLDLRLDSIYLRFTGISGIPLRDGFHFGQTLINDYGRPYGEGFNDVTGVSGSAVAGPLSFSVRGEYQHAPSVASDPPNVLQAIASEDGVVTPLPDGSGTLDRLRLIEASVGLTFNNVKLSFGRQNVWLGPGESGALLLSDNAQPFTMLQLDSASPFEFPLLSRFLGPARMTSFLGQLSGQQWIYNPPVSEGLNPNVDPSFLIGPGFHPQPFIHGNKISFHPTANLEFGMGVTAMFGGPGLPFTWHEFFRSYYGHNANTATNPAKRFSSFDFSYRLPGLRRWLTFYTDSLVGDEISPLGSTRPMLNPGIYFPQLPKLPKLEIRVEGFKAEPRLGTIYIDRRYHSGYTNDGNLIGSWIGRQALGGQGWVKYSFTPRTNLQLEYRHQEVDHFLAGGGRLNDFAAAGEYRLSRQVALSARAQYEVWNFPALAAGNQPNFTAQVQMSFFPHWRLGR